MDVFRFTNQGAHELQMNCGEIINGLLSVEWIEKYQEASEFKLEAPMWIDPLSTIPVGTFIGKIDSDVVMIVENHELTQKKGELPKVIISGRELHRVALGRRCIGSQTQWDGAAVRPTGESMNHHYHSNFTYGNLEDPENFGQRSWESVNLLIHWLPNTTDMNNDWEDDWPPQYFKAADRLQWFEDEWDVTSKERLYDSDETDYWSNVERWLQVDNFGMETIRPYRSGSSESATTESEETIMRVHPGRDKTRSVIFSHDTGEILSSEHLWSDKDYYTHVYIRTTHMAYMYRPVGGPTGWDRRVLYHDYSEIDSQWDLTNGNTYVITQEDLDEDPSFTPAKARDKVMSACRVRTEELLNKHRKTNVSTIEVDRQITTYRYREDFRVGDLITVDPGFTDPEVRRVIEYVEIEDERGYVGYPVLDVANDKVFGHD